MNSLAGIENPTRLIGLAAYFFSAMMCGCTWIRSLGTPRPLRLGAVLAMLNACLFFDILLDGRWRLHDLLEGEAIARSLYIQRTIPQIAALVLLGIVMAFGMVRALVRYRGRAGATMAVCGAVLSLGCWCAEVISLHTVDAVFYCTVKGVMLVSMSWIISSLMMGLGILWDTRTASAHGVPRGGSVASLTNS
jgi:hypothetical protein